MSIHTNFLTKAIDTTQRRFAVLSPKHVKRGHIILIGDELMMVRRCHRDGTITVDRGIEWCEPSPHRHMESAISGKPEYFDLKRNTRRKR